MARICQRLFSVVLAVSLLLLPGLVAPASSFAQDATRQSGEPQISAGEAIVVEYPSGRVLYEKSAHTRMPPASLTKILTAILALEYGNLNDVITVAPEDLVGESTMGLVSGEQQTLHNLLYGMLLPSGNDAALAVARYLGSHVGADKPLAGDPVARFATMMNARVSQLGLTDSHFVTPHGLDTPDHYSSAYDLASLSWYALHIPTFNEIVKSVSYEAPGHSLLNTNEMLTRYAGTDGIKTGWTDGCGLCLVTSATRDGHRLISVVLNAPSWYADSSAILDYGFSVLAAKPTDAKAEVLSISKRDTVTWLLANPAAAPPLPDVPVLAQGGGAASQAPQANAAAGAALVTSSKGGPGTTQSAPAAVLVVATGKTGSDLLLVLAIFGTIGAMCCLLLARLWGVRITSFRLRAIPVTPSAKIPNAAGTVTAAAPAVRPRPARARSWSGMSKADNDESRIPLPTLARRREPNLLSIDRSDVWQHIDRAVAHAAEGRQGSGMSEFVMALKGGAHIDVVDLAERYRLSSGAFLALSRAQMVAGQPQNARRTLLHGVLVMPSERVLRLALYQLQPDE